jgi:predicted dehydrogenase
MREKKNQSALFNRRDFLRGGSTATLLTMLGGMKVVAQSAGPSALDEDSAQKVKVAVIGLGPRGREIVSTFGQMKKAELVAVCDLYPEALRRAAKLAPRASRTDDYRTIIEDKEILAVVVATPTYQHKDVVLAALQAGKHVYCEAPLAPTVLEAKEIALAAQGAPHLVFQPGLHWRCDPNRRELIRTFRSGALGQPVLVRTQWHKKQSWRAASANPKREDDLNWRLRTATSLGLTGELLGQHMDQARWFFNQLPVAVSGLARMVMWNDGREVADTVQLVLEFPGGVPMLCDATLANSFDGEYEAYYGTYAAVLLRQSDIWLFKEVDAPLFGWEVYFPKQTFHQETGIVLKVGASKSVPLTELEKVQQQIEQAPLYCALNTFIRNAEDLTAARVDFLREIGDDDPDALREHLTTSVLQRPAPNFRDGFEAAVIAIKANEAILSGQRIVLNPDNFQLG